MPLKKKNTVLWLHKKMEITEWVHAITSSLRALQELKVVLKLSTQITLQPTKRIIKGTGGGQDATADALSQTDEHISVITRNVTVSGTEPDGDSDIMSSTETFYQPASSREQTLLHWGFAKVSPPLITFLCVQIIWGFATFLLFTL